MKHPFTITPHDLKQQLDAWMELATKRDKDWKNSFAPTEYLQRGDNCTAFDDDALDEIQKIERKR